MSKKCSIYDTYLQFMTYGPCNAQICSYVPIYGHIFSEATLFAPCMKSKAAIYWFRNAVVYADSKYGCLHTYMLTTRKTYGTYTETIWHMFVSFFHGIDSVFYLLGLASLIAEPKIVRFVTLPFNISDVRLP